MNKLTTNLLPILLVLVLSGCSQWGAVKVAIGDAGAHAADEALSVSIWQICNASSYGAIKRKFSGDADKANALKVLCGGTEKTSLIVRDTPINIVNDSEH